VTELARRVRLTRPYLLTGGRTRSAAADLAIESLIITTDAGHREADELQAEHGEIASLCQLPRSLAEVAALTKLPLGVTRVLVGDMVGDGLLNVQQNSGEVELPFLERLLDGLRAL
jgi:Protein of unknown function (DUF742)